jgi:hypothetical protein
MSQSGDESSVTDRVANNGAEFGVAECGKPPDLVGANGLEPLTFAVSRQRSTN